MVNINNLASLFLIRSKYKSLRSWYLKKFGACSIDSSYNDFNSKDRTTRKNADINHNHALICKKNILELSELVKKNSVNMLTEIDTITPDKKKK